MSKIKKNINNEAKKKAEPTNGSTSLLFFISN